MEHTLIDMETLEGLLEGLVTIPTVPSTLVEINEILNDPDGSAQEAGKVVSKDPAVAVKVLRLVNSAYYALKNPVSDVSFAVSILGLKVLKNLVVQATVLESFGSNGKAGNLSEEYLWEHSFKAAVAAAMIAKHAKKKLQMIPEEAYTCGLVHDVGKIIMAENLGAKYTKALFVGGRKKLSASQAEMEAFQFDHAAVGALLADKWGLSPRMVKALRFHHLPWVLEEDQEPADRYLGHMLSAADGLAREGHEANHPMPPGQDWEKSLETLEIDEETRAAILEDVEKTSRDL